jgi:hypothetical protein
MSMRTTTSSEAEEKDSANIIAVRQRASEFFQALELDE